MKIKLRRKARMSTTTCCIYTQIFNNPGDLQFSLARDAGTGKFGLLITRGVEGKYQMIHAIPIEYSRIEMIDALRRILMVALSELPDTSRIDLDAYGGDLEDDLRQEAETQPNLLG